MSFVAVGMCGTQIVVISDSELFTGKGLFALHLSLGQILDIVVV